MWQRQVFRDASIESSGRQSTRLGITHWLIVAALLAVTLWVYWPTFQFGFVNLDDTYNVRENPHVNTGLSLANVRWAFTSFYAANWHPLTWVSFMIDAERSNTDPRAFHVTNVILHLLNTVLLVIVMHVMTRAFWPSVMVAAWFALHPMHVESVAWIAERKDVLFTLFWLLAMLAYVWHVRGGGWLAYTVVGILAVMGMMAKPMTVTLPCVLLLMDVWPLRRVIIKWNDRRESFRSFWRAMVHKIPLLAITVGMFLATGLAQSSTTATMHAINRDSWLNIPMAYGLYITKMFWPVNLAAFYPLPGRLGSLPWPLFSVILASIGLLFTTVLAITVVRRVPYVLVGWLWFLGTLVPVIGLVQIGMQGMADRYSYVPHIGLFIVLAWLAVDLARRHRWLAATISLIMIASVVACAVRSRDQVKVWKDTDTLYSHMIAVTRDNWPGHMFRADYLTGEGRFDEALVDAQRLVELVPDSVDGLRRVGLLQYQLRQYYDAQITLEKAIAYDPNDARSHFFLSRTLARRMQPDRAKHHLQVAMRLAPESAELFQREVQQLLDRHR